MEFIAERESQRVEVKGTPQEDRAGRVLILAPLGRDADLMCAVLGGAGIACHPCADADELLTLLDREANTVLVTEEALTASLMSSLAQRLDEQPPWSDIPIVILTGHPSIEAKVRSFGGLGRRANITLVDRPVRMKTLLTTVESVLRSRDRQYEIRDLMRLLEERVHERDKFLAILGHELRNPLGAILLATEMTDSDGTLEGENVDRIQRQARHLTQLVNDLLDLSRVTSGKIVLKPALINFREVVEQALETIRSLNSHHLDISFHCTEESIYVSGDPLRLEQIVSNVLSNALKYTPDGGAVEVTLDCEGREAVLCVRDTGVGISPDRIGSIFELFAQAENAIGRSQGGMGIGLSLVRNLVQLHGGSVAVKSDGIGHGSEFTIRLPIAAEVPAIKPQPERPRASVLDSEDRRTRIVVVEDNPDVRDLLRLKLGRLGYEVETASDGDGGLATILAVRPDFALVDIGLPGRDGHDIAREVRAELGSDIVLIALSGFGMPDDKKKAAEAGFDEHMTKPAEMSQLAAILQKHSKVD